MAANLGGGGTGRPMTGRAEGGYGRQAWRRLNGAANDGKGGGRIWPPSMAAAGRK